MVKRASETKDTASRSTRSTDAPGPDLGYSLQRTRFLARLLGAEVGDVVCLEVFDDVRLQRADGTSVSEEDKSTLGRNPIADRSVDLWKTIANWVNAAAAGHVAPANTRFEIYVSQPVSGEFSDRIRGARTIGEAESALIAIRTELWGSEPQYELRDGVAESLAPFVNEVFGDDFEIATAIVANLEINCGSGDQHADLKPLLFDKFVGEDSYDDVLRWSHGWVKIKLDRLLEQGLPAIIERDEFHAAIVNYIQHHDRVDYLRSFAGEPTEPEIEAQRFMTYVAQIEIVDADEVDILTAVSDYLMAAADRTKWAERGDIDDDALRSFEKLLKRIWKNTKDQVLLEHIPNTEREQGHLTWLKCMSYNADLDGLAVPSHFVPGSFHALAHVLEIGWHPNYRSELERYRATDSSLIGES